MGVTPESETKLPAQFITPDGRNAVHKESGVGNEPGALKRVLAVGGRQWGSPPQEARRDPR
jgi:hypothetical protein